MRTLDEQGDEMNGGAGGAAAWTFATTSSPQSAIYNGAAFGHGAGNIYRQGFNYVLADVSLRDPVVNNRAVYQESQATTRAGSTRGQTGRHSGSTWRSMPRVSLYGSAGWVGATGFSTVCEDASLRPDICSTTRSAYL